jgi:polysaccharide pyruvyl transferase WcaK-like protein
MQSRYGKIALLHHVGSGNLGDDVTLDTIIENIRRRCPNALIAAFTANPEDTKQRHQLPSYPIRRTPWGWYQPPTPELTPKTPTKAQSRRYRFLPRLVSALFFRLPRALYSEGSFLMGSRRILSSFEVLIISGGGQLTEWGGPWSFLYTLLKWVLLAKSAHIKCLFLNVGAGPLTQPLSKLFARWALDAADYVSFRDDQSRMLASQIGFKGSGQVFSDCVYIREAPAPKTAIQGHAGQLTVGIAPMPYCDPRVDPAERNLVIYQAFIDKLAIFTSSLIRNSNLLTMFGTDIGVDPLAIKDLQLSLLHHHNLPTLDYQTISTVDELLARMSALDYVVTCRFHGVVLAHLLNKPVLALSHHPKVTTLMNDLGLSKYCVDIRTFDPAVLIEKFASLVAETDEIKDRMAVILGKYRSRLITQFDELFLS